MSWPDTGRRRLLDAVRGEVQLARARAVEARRDEAAREAAIREDPTGQAQRAECDRLRQEQAAQRARREADLRRQALAALGRLRRAARAELADHHRDAWRALAVAPFVGRDPAALSAEREARALRLVDAWDARAREELRRWEGRLAGLGEALPWTVPARLPALEAAWFGDGPAPPSAVAPPPPAAPLGITARAVVLGVDPLDAPADDAPPDPEGPLSAALTPHERGELSAIARAAEVDAARPDPAPPERDGGWGPILRAWRAY